MDSSMERDELVQACVATETAYILDTLVSGSQKHSGAAKRMRRQSVMLRHDPQAGGPSSAVSHISGSRLGSRAL